MQGKFDRTQDMGMDLCLWIPHHYWKKKYIDKQLQDGIRFRLKQKYKNKHRKNITQKYILKKSKY